MSESSHRPHISYKPFEPEDFAAVIALGNEVHGDNYLDMPGVESLYNKSQKQGINASFVAYHGSEIAGFRLTLAAQQWQIDEWCSPERWQIEPDKMCYFKSVAVPESSRGLGIASNLLKLSIEQAKKQGAQAGLAHIWMGSPANSAYEYFSRCGGELVKTHPNRWQGWFKSHGYICPVCGEYCTCAASEMMIRF